MTSGRWPVPSHQTGTNKEGGVQSQQRWDKAGYIRSERRLALTGPQLDQKNALSVIAYQSKRRFIHWLFKERQIC